MEIKIGRSAHKCSTCERLFVHEEELMSTVRIENQVLVRGDFCQTCWQPQKATGVVSQWKFRFYDPKVAEQQPAEVFSPLRHIFYEAAESEERTELAVAYLAAQLLRRQKVFRLLKESDATEREVRLTLFADRIADRLIEVRDPNLSYAELETGRGLLLERLQAKENPQGAQNAQPELTAESTHQQVAAQEVNDAQAE